MDYTIEERRQVSLEWARNEFERHKNYMNTLDKSTTRKEYMEVIEQNVDGSWDYLQGILNNPDGRMRDKDTTILLEFKGVRRSTGYPEKGNRYYWNKKGQPKLWKLRLRLKMFNISKWERDVLFPMAY